MKKRWSTPPAVIAATMASPTAAPSGCCAQVCAVVVGFSSDCMVHLRAGSATDETITQILHTGFAQITLLALVREFISQRFMTRLDRLTAIDVEQINRAEQRATGLADRALHIGGRYLLADHEGQIFDHWLVDADRLHRLKAPA